MSNIINQNLDEIISIKNQLSNVLIENGVEAGNRFSDYPDMFRSVIASGGGSIDEETLYSYIGDYLDSYNYIDQDSLSANSYATQSYVMDKIGAIPSVDLSSYVTHTELNNAGYITTGYISNHDIIPATDGFYQLGDATYRYLQIATKYAFVTDELTFGRQKITHQDDSNSLTVVTNTFDRIIFNNNGIIPAANNTYTLGNSSNKWGITYTANLYTNTAYLQDTSYTKTVVPDGSDTYTLGDTSNYYHTLYTNRVRGNSSVNFVAGGNNRVTVTGTAMRPMQQNYNLGSSDYPFATAYISNIYNFIWTGTSAEYAALDNYTSYQIYMIKES